MQLSTSALLLLACFAASVSAQNKIKCYSCNSETNPHCSDPLNMGEDLKPVECTNDITNSILGNLNTGLKGISNFLGLEKTPQIDANFVCLKGAYTRKLDDGSERKVVLRTCALEGKKICDSINQKSNEQGIKDVFCEECTTDACNGASLIHAAACILLPAFALLLRNF